MARANRLRILLTHSNAMRANYYGSRALAGLQAAGDVRLNESDKVWDAQGVIAAAQDRELIVADRQTAGRSAASARIARSSAAESRPGAVRCQRWKSSSSCRWCFSDSSHRRSNSLPTRRFSGSHAWY